MAALDTNTTGLRIAEQTSLGVLGASPLWMPVEPNEYAEFGPQFKRVARETINPGRQRRKGRVTDLDAVAGWKNDFTQRSLFKLFQGFMFADWRIKAQKAVSAVSGTQFTVASGGTSFLVGSLLLGENFATAANNGLKAVTASTGTTISVSGLTAEASPPADAQITSVGFRGATGDLVMTVASSLAQLESTVADFTTWGLIPGEWLWIGGDATANKFATAVCNGPYRIKSIAANLIIFDRAPGTPTADTGTGKNLDVYWGHVIKNESLPANQKTRWYTLERFMGTGGPGYEYVKDAIANTLKMTLKSTEKVELEFGFIGLDHEDSATQLAAGTRPSLPAEDMYECSSDFGRLRLLDEVAAATLGSYFEEITLSIDNGAEPSKALATLGGFDVSLGDFVVSGTMKGYFTTFEALAAVRASKDVSMDFMFTYGTPTNIGYLFDVPLIGLGDGRRTAEKNKKIMTDMTTDAAGHPTLDHTLLIVNFPYLPQAAL